MGASKKELVQNWQTAISKKSPKNEPAASGEKMQLTNCCRMKVQHFAAAICTKNRFNVSAKVVLRGSRKGKRRLQGFNVEATAKHRNTKLCTFVIVTDVEEGSFHGFSAECWKRWYILHVTPSKQTFIKRFANWCVRDGFLKIYQEICGYMLNSFLSQLQTNLSQVWHVFATSLMPHFGAELHQISMPPDAGCPDHTASDWSKVFCTSSE